MSLSDTTHYKGNKGVETLYDYITHIMLIGTILSITDSFQLAWQDSVIASNVTTACLVLAQCKPGPVCDGW